MSLFFARLPHLLDVALLAWRLLLILILHLVDQLLTRTGDICRYLVLRIALLLEWTLLVQILTHARKWILGVHDMTDGSLIECTSLTWGHS
jgi:hypothetical protein